MSLCRAAGGECDNDGSHHTPRHVGDRLSESGTYDLMTTSEIYSFLWQCQPLCDYVVSVAPSAILRYVMACRGEGSNAYIINVLRRQKSLKRAGGDLGNCKKKKKHSPESPCCLQGVEGATRVAGEGMSPGPDRAIAAGVSARKTSSRGESIGHWIVLVINPTGNELFDSLGEVNASTYGREVEEFVKVNDCQFVNNELLDTKNCAFYCLLFCYYKSLGLASAAVVEKLKKYHLNIVEKFKKVFPLRL